ncbi:MAG: hypothetical protein DMG31_06840 [Acidobacteria bacterium]|nr:MAG: hypothetical protein DMG31_06840 [Acidobacteriota bacterium]
MNYRYFGSMATLALGVMVLLTAASAAGQASSPVAKTTSAHKALTPPRTADGQPDLQGVWTNNTVTPLERPKGLAGKELYTEAELQALAKKERERLSQIEDEGQPPANHSGVEGAPADDVHYDFSQFGLDRGQSKLAWNRRTSIIVGPDGKIPPLTPEARARLAEIRAKAKGHEFDGPENLTLGARCLARPNVAPLLPTAYNSNLQIVQGRGYVAIETEEIHDVRIIPTDGRPHIPKTIHQWYGDSVGHWEGNTLVIDTTNFTDLSPFRGAQNLHMIERLTRADEDTILYQFTVEDPGMWTKPWSGELPIVKIQGQLYEYACHEANYALADTLRGARVTEEQAAKKSAK